MNGQMTEQEAIEELRKAKAILGRYYKEPIRICWETGRYNDYGLQELNLQTVRNVFGPSWLNSVRLSDTQE